MRWLASWLPGALALSLGGCGGKVVVDAAGTGGAGGASVSSSSSSASSTTSTTSSSVSSSSSASSASSSSGGLTCPAPFPGIFAGCAVEGQQCPVPLSCCNAQAICKSGFWQFAGPICDQICEPDCGPDGFACQTGTLCVTYIGAITTYQCRQNPCFEDIGCGCVNGYCAEQMMSCNNIQGDYKVLCD